MTRMPALSLAAVPGRRKGDYRTGHRNREAGLHWYLRAVAGRFARLCEALAFATNEINFGTSIMPIYFRDVADFATDHVVHP
ncbi:MAG: hypothetical protein U5O39_16370 [Gammaproteobacteria bacterium]|nr:hypothetical protein [Gammaproteobacteria bacterium]